MTTTTTCTQCDKRLTAAQRKAGDHLCQKCNEVAMLENEHQDGAHEGKPSSSCPMCGEAEIEADPKPLTRKQCKEILQALGYEGPTSYLMPKVREIVATAQAHAEHKDQADPSCSLCPSDAA